MIRASCGPICGIGTSANRMPGACSGLITAFIVFVIEVTPGFGEWRVDSGGCRVESAGCRVERNIWPCSHARAGLRPCPTIARISTCPTSIPPNCLQEKAATTPESLPCLRDNVTMLQVAGCPCHLSPASTIIGGTLSQEPERIVILGFRGQLGRALMERLADRQILALDFPEVDMTQPAIVEQVVDFRPEVVINAAAWTNVDGAEDTPDACYAVNVTGVQHLALACQRSGAALVQVSTNEVFPGEPARFYREWDATAARSGTYARSKEAAEKVARRRGHADESADVLAPRPPGRGERRRPRGPGRTPSSYRRG